MTDSRLCVVTQWGIGLICDLKNRILLKRNAMRQLQQNVWSEDKVPTEPGNPVAPFGLIPREQWRRDVH